MKDGYIDDVMKQFHLVANNPPSEDPSTWAGQQAWNDWTELCRGFEVELIEAGVNL